MESRNDCEDKHRKLRCRWYKKKSFYQTKKGTLKSKQELKLDNVTRTQDLGVSMWSSVTCQKRLYYTIKCKWLPMETDVFLLKWYLIFSLLVPNIWYIHLKKELKTLYQTELSLLFSASSITVSFGWMVGKIWMFVMRAAVNSGWPVWLHSVHWYSSVFHVSFWCFVL